MDRIYLSDKDNIEFKYMDSCDKLTYLNQLKDYIIEYRDSLGLGSSVTFGTEIEYQGVEKEIIDKEIEDNFLSFKSIVETNIDIGGEVISIPMRDDIANWRDLRHVLNMIRSQEGIILDSKTSSHVHIGANVLRNYDNLLKFILLYSIYEGTIYRFAYMNRCNPRESMIPCAPPCAIKLAEDYEDISAIKRVSNINNRYDRFNGINFMNLSSLKNYKEKNTIEFRMANGSLDPVLWQNIINLYSKLLLASTKDLDIDELIYKSYRLNYNRTNYSGFDKLDMPVAFEFADIVFDNILDKTNFLKQYYKDGTETQSEYNPTIVKSFTRYKK